MYARKIYVKIQLHAYIKKNECANIAEVSFSSAETMYKLGPLLLWILFVFLLFFCILLTK